MAILCMIFPAMLFCQVREQLLKREYEDKCEKILKIIFEYFCGNVLINVILVGYWIYVRHKTGNIFSVLNEYGNFAIKYLIMGIILAIIIPYCESYMKKNILVSFDLGLCIKPFSKRAINVLVLIYALSMGGLVFLRCIDNSFWGDEGIVVRAARLNWEEMLKYVAQNGHTPFHYAFAWLMVRMFGESGFIYHISAALPYFIMLVLSVFFIKKQFGSKATIIFITLSSFLKSAVIYNLEIRMYVWTQLFILLMFLMLYKVLETQKNKYYIFMSIFSIGAVYSHYFALAAIGLCYFVLLIYTFFEKKRDIWKVILSGGLIIVALFPWLIYAKQIRGTVISNYSIGEVSFQECIDFIFYSEHSMMLLIIFFATLCFKFCYDYKIISIIELENKKHVIFGFPNKKIKLTKEWIWLFSGITAVFGTIIAAEILSELLYPIIVLRYLYPMYIIMWLLFGKIISDLKLAKLWTIILVVFVIVTGYPNYINTYKIEKANNTKLENTLEMTQSEIGDSAYIYTDIVHFAWTVCDVYYPDTPHNLFGNPSWWGPERLTDLNIETTDYWLFLSQPISENVLIDLTGQNLEAVLIVDNGYIGTGNVWVYKVILKKEQ